MITLRPATLEDASFVAWTVLTAVGITDIGHEQMMRVTEMCRRSDVLYSWKNSMIAENDGRAVGCLIAYNGADYQQLRQVTFELIAREGGYDFRNMEPETEAGEYYLDSMAVLPEYRGQGIATQLLQAGIERARQLHLGRVSMVVSPEKPEVQRLYESLGFKYECDMFLFNEDYRKMVKKL